MRKNTILWLVLSLAVICPLRADEDSPLSEETVTELRLRLSSIDEELAALKKWKGKFKSQYRQLNNSASRIQFRNGKDSLRSRTQAQDAKDNMEAIEISIEELLVEKERIIEELRG